MPDSSTGRYTDAADYRASQSDIFATMSPTHPGAFDVRVARVTLRHLHLFQARECQPRIAYVTLSPERVAVSFPADHEPPLIWRGTPLRQGEIMLHTVGERLHQRTEGTSFWGLIALPAAFLDDYYKIETGCSVVLPEFSQILRPASPDRKDLLRVHGAAARLAMTKPRILDHPEVIRALEHELAGLLVRCLANADIRPEAPSARKAAQIMTGFEDILAATLNRGLTSAEITKALGVNGRTFRKICQSFLGIGAHRYIRLRQLQLARSAILHEDPRTARIADLARHAGFTDPSRFAAEYRAAFGETPTATLRRTGGALT